MIINWLVNIVSIERSEIPPGISAPYTEMKSLSLAEARTPAFAPGTKGFARGEQVADKALKLPCDIALDQNVSIPRLLRNFEPTISVIVGLHLTELIVSSAFRFQCSRKGGECRGRLLDGALF
jgi:hypothetical protein